MVPTHTQAVSVVKDPTSDMAQLARKGSTVLLEARGQQERNKMRKKFWELGGSKMGDLIGVQKNAEDVAEARQGEEEDGDAGKHSNKYGDMKKSEAASEFSRSKTMKEQREFLPIFTVREQLLQVVRDFNVIIIVGETGSGKTTQLTQYATTFLFSKINKNDLFIHFF